MRLVSYELSGGPLNGKFIHVLSGASVYMAKTMKYVSGEIEFHKHIYEKNEDCNFIYKGRHDENK